MAVVDIGSGTVTSRFSRRVPVAHRCSPSAAKHFTNDVAGGAAHRRHRGRERVKKKHGCVSLPFPKEDMIEVQSVGTKKRRIMGRQLLPRSSGQDRRGCQLVLAEIRKSGFDQSPNGGIVSPAAEPCSKAWSRSASRSSTCRCGLGTPRNHRPGGRGVLAGPRHRRRSVPRSHRARLGEGRLLQEDAGVPAPSASSRGPGDMPILF